MISILLVKIATDIVVRACAFDYKEAQLRCEFGSDLSEFCGICDSDGW